MPYRTRYGSHYHMEEGCHGASIPCDMNGLEPCSDCCGSRGGGGGGMPIGGVAADQDPGIVPEVTADDKGGAGENVTGISGTTGRAPQPSPDAVAAGIRRRKRKIPNAAGCVYTGYFVGMRQVMALVSELDGQGARDGAGTLDKVIPVPHVTLSYMPDDAHEDLFGSGAKLRVVAYGNDGRNEGVLVEVADEESEGVSRLTASVARLHITLSVAEGARPADTAKLDFVPLEAPIVLDGTYGGCRGGADVVLEPMPTPTPRNPEQGMGRGAKPTDPARGGDASHAVSYDDATAPMRNPEIPPTGIARDIRGLAAEISASDGALFVMRGSAGCGKSSVLSAVGLGGDAATVVCPDDIRVRLFGLEADADGNLSIPQRDGNRVWGIAAREATRACAAPGKPVVIDAMHTRPRDIRQWQQLADRTGRKLVVIDLTDVPREVARQRNAGRVGWKQVPEFVIDRFYDVAKRNTRSIRDEFTCVDRQGLARLMGMLASGGKQDVPRVRRPQ